MHANQKVKISLLLLLAALTLLTVYWIYRGGANPAWTMPEPSLSVQTQTTEGLTISLRNASYTDEKITLGIEVTGGGQTENDLGYEFYDGDRKFASSASGFVHKLGDRHECVTVENEEVSGLPDVLDLRVKVLARSNPLEPHNLHADFRLELDRK